jgi:hypothetical protein
MGTSAPISILDARYQHFLPCIFASKESQKNKINTKYISFSQMFGHSKPSQEA